MSVHFNLNLYWLLVPLAVGLLYWAFHDKQGGFSLLWRLPLAGCLWLAAALALVLLHLYVR